jgi:hypothetical protein
MLIPLINIVVTPIIIKTTQLLDHSNIMIQLCGTFAAGPFQQSRADL